MTTIEPTDRHHRHRNDYLHNDDSIHRPANGAEQKPKTATPLRESLLQIPYKITAIFDFETFEDFVYDRVIGRVGVAMHIFDFFLDFSGEKSRFLVVSLTVWYVCGALMIFLSLSSCVIWSVFELCIWFIIVVRGFIENRYAWRVMEIYSD